MSSDYLLQMQWDAALLKAWRDNGLMLPRIAAFMRAHKLTHEQFDALKRVPPFIKWGSRSKWPVRAFVASCLPALSDRLWAGIPDEQLLDFMDGLRSAAGQVNGLRKQLKAEDRRQNQLRRIHQHRGHLRSDWNVCKP